MMALKKTYKVDLHCHSTCSDGSLSPYELIDLARSLGLTGLSITDHDTIEAYPDIITYGTKYHLSIIPGVEFSAQYRQTSIHILAYSFSLNHPNLLAFCKKHKERRKERTKLILQRLKRQNIFLLYDDIIATQSQVPGRPHIAMTMVRKGYVSSIKEAFNRYLGDNKSCFVPTNTFSVEETLDQIHSFNGVAVLAHPHLIKNKNLVKSLLQMPFDGIECFYARFSNDLCQYWQNIAEENKLLITGGSDFHGNTKPQSKLGSHLCPKESFLQLEKHFSLNNPQLQPNDEPL